MACIFSSLALRICSIIFLTLLLFQPTLGLCPNIMGLTLQEHYHLAKISHSLQIQGKSFLNDLDISNCDEAFGAWLCRLQDVCGCEDCLEICIGDFVASQHVPYGLELYLRVGFADEGRNDGRAQVL